MKYEQKNTKKTATQGGREEAPRKKNEWTKNKAGLHENHSKTNNKNKQTNSKQSRSQASGALCCVLLLYRGTAACAHGLGFPTFEDREAFSHR